MMMNLFQVLLFTGMVPFVLPVYRRYYLIQHQNAWQGAKSYCQAEHNNLAVIKSSDDMIELQREAQMHGFSSPAWIGLYNDIDSWRWSFKNETLNNKYWALGQPNNAYGQEECGRADYNGWVDDSCNSVMPVLCYDERKLGADRYIYVSKPMNWYDAQDYCRTNYTDLAIIKNSSDSQTVQKIAQNKNHLWIGLFRDSWKWMDKTSMSSMQWGNGQPDNHLKNETCGYIRDRLVYDSACSSKIPFFCYSDIIERKQTIKVKIQSKQNVSDPAVQAAILEKIKEKLKEYEMTQQITVTWVEQPGGVVSRKSVTAQSCDL